jgi:hypothetical protein
MYWITAWATGALLAGVLASLLAARKKRDRYAWTAWSFVFPPAVLILWWLPARAAPARRPEEDDDEGDEIEDLLGDKSD